MDSYEVFLFFHIAAAAMWIGAGMLLLVLAFKADRTNDAVRFQHILEDQGKLANTYFIPASLAVLIFGVIMTIDAWEFDQLWIVLGLLGYLSTFITGAFVLGPRGERIGAQIAERGMGAAEMLEARKLVTLARIDYIVLFLVVFDMAVKPTGDDTGALILMAAVLVIGVGLTALRYRALDAQSTAPAAA